MSYRIVSDGSCDLPVEDYARHNLTVVPFYVSFDEVNYKREIAEVPIRDFYDQMVLDKKTFPKSSLPGVQDYIDAFTPIVEAGDDIICISITGKFSGSYQSATVAKETIAETYPNAKITIIDSIMATVLQGILVLEAAKLCNEGVPYEEAVTRLESIKDSGRIFFTVGSLDYLQHGGRIGKLSSLAGSLLSIRPIITMKEGEIFSSGVSRGRKKSLEKVIEILLEYLKSCPDNAKDYRLCIGYGYDKEEAVQFQQQTISYLKENGYSFTEEDFPLYQIGATIAVHTGPYPLGFGILKRA